MGKVYFSHFLFARQKMSDARCLWSPRTGSGTIYLTNLFVHYFFVPFNFHFNRTLTLKYHCNGIKLSRT
jgi:hypothetical protein